MNPVRWRATVLLSVASGLCSAQSFDTIGRSETISEPEFDWVFVGTSLIDVTDDRFLGLLSLGGTGLGAAPLRLSRDGSSIFVPETFRTRGNRGERTDTVTIFDTATLAVSGEIVIPPKRALMSPVDGSTAMTDDGRLLAVYNLTPAQSISVVDVDSRTFVGEIATPGCSLVFGAGDRRFFMICANGDVLNVELNADGTERSKARIQGFFDPGVDPIRENGARFGDEWIFASFEGLAHSLQVSANGPEIGDSWPLLSDRDRRQSWRIAGSQNLAVHQATGRLYSLVRQSEEPLDDPADFDGTEIWVYDLATRQRVDRFEAVPDREDSGGGGGLGGSTGDGAAGIIVTQGDNPLLVTVGGGGVSVRNAMSGEYLHETLERAPGEGRLALRVR
ncbi:MAG: amine dehydrogenase large subunit [Gammaproteobacteria bacterium]|jgi:methylamine dehydrogenase heavy chain